MQIEHLIQLNNLMGIECTASKMGDYFTVNEKQPVSVISKFKIPHIRVEKITTGKGYRNIHLTDNVINFALQNGMQITAPAKVLFEAKREIELASAKFKLMAEVESLENQVKDRKYLLVTLNKQIELAAHKLSMTINDPLLNEDEIFLLAGIRRQKCGVYFLIKENKIVYVGQSININERIKEHERTKDFDRFTYVECDRSNLSEMEAKYIFKFKPIYNYDVNGRLVMPATLTVDFNDAINRH